MPAKGEVLVMNESSDWYVVPIEKRDEWYDKWSYTDDPPNWAIYIQDPESIILYEWEDNLR